MSPWLTFLLSLRRSGWRFTGWDGWIAHQRIAFGRWDLQLRLDEVIQENLYNLNIRRQDSSICLRCSTIDDTITCFGQEQAVALAKAMIESSRLDRG